MSKIHLDKHRTVEFRETPSGNVTWWLRVDGELTQSGEASTVDDALATIQPAPLDADREIALVAFQLPQVAKALRAILAEVRKG